MVPKSIWVAVATLLPSAVSMVLNSDASALPLALSTVAHSDGGALPLTLTTIIAKSERAIADMEQVFERSDESHWQAMNAISKNLTLSSAIEALEKSALDSPNFRQVASLLTGKQNLRSTHDGFGGLDGARKLLNDMIHETMVKYDKEVAKCSDYYAKQCALMEAARGQISASSFVAATARALILDASATIKKESAAIPVTEVELKEHGAKCKTGVKALNEKLKKVMGDIDIITMILKSTDCDKKLLQTEKLVLLRCKDQCTEQDYVTFNHGPLQQEMNQLDKPAHDLVAQTFADLFTGNDEPVPVKLVQLAGSEYQKVVSVTNEALPPKPRICASEGGECQCSGQVFFGKKFEMGKPGSGTPMTLDKMKLSAFKQEAVDVKVKCNNAVFGDPVPGYKKHCYCVEQASRVCAKREGDTCKCTGRVYFGKKFVSGKPGTGGITTFEQLKQSPIIMKAVDTEIKCSNKDMGKDPVQGFYKHCYCVEQAPQKKMKFNNPPAPKTKIPSNPCTDPNAGMPAPMNKRSGKCSLTKSPQCYKLQGRFLQIQGRIADERDQLMEDIEKLQDSCKETSLSLEASIENDNTNLASAQTKLAGATEKEAGAGENGRQVTKENEQYQADLQKQMKTCTGNYANFENELCSLKKIRGDLYKKMKPGHKGFFQDCEVSKWTPEACTKKCAGGEQKLIRNVMTHPKGGSKCLPLTAKKSCNLGACPVNCKLQAWSGWNKCSSKCGGGVQQRVRDVKQAPKYNGKPCGPTSESKQCAVDACEKDCALGRWTKWTKCSKDCDGGTKKRQRMVKEPVQGAGKCANKWDVSRLEYTQCNMKRCALSNPNEVMKCKQTFDIVLLLDGTPKSGQAAWKAEATAANLFVDAFTGDTQIAIIHYAGPRTWSGVSRCVGKSTKKVDMKKDCKVTVAQHLDPSRPKTKNVINGLQFTPGAKLLSLALMAVPAEMALGRKKARTVVVVFIDGEPLSARKTLLASKTIRKKTRLVYVPVTKFSPLAPFKKWATSRWQENVVKVTDAKEMLKPELGTHIIANICPSTFPKLKAR